MSTAGNPLALAGALLAYPGDGYGDTARRLAGAMDGADREAAAHLCAFADAIGLLPLSAQQELYTQTFDLSPVCALEVGWHLFGEDYKRGVFLVEMRQALAAHGIEEGGELPDHLSSLLQLADALGDDDARALVTKALQPALARMIDPLEKAENPFRWLMQGIQRLLAGRAAAGQEVVHV